MQPPKYKFFTCKRTIPNKVTQNYLEDDGSYSEGANSFSTDIQSILYGEKLLYISLPYDAKRDSGSISGGTELYSFSFKVVFYNAERKAIKSGLYTSSSLIEIPIDATHYAVCGIFMVFELREAIKFLVEQGVVYLANQCEPHYTSLSKKYVKENGQMFFRAQLEGKINLFGDAYEYVKNSDLECDFAFIVTKLNAKSNNWYEYYKGTFNKTDCILDYEKKKCELKLTTLDEYNTIMDGYDNMYDLIKLEPEITKLNMHKRALVQVYVRGANSITNYSGSTYWEDDILEPVDNGDELINKYHFAYVRAGNEFYIENASIEKVNGVYAGVNGVWNNWNEYQCRYKTGNADNTGRAHFEIINTNTEEVVYRSAQQYSNIEPNNVYLNREDVLMINVNDSNDSFVIKSPFVYHVYQRLLCDVSYISNTGEETYDIPIDDFVVGNRNYKKCIPLKIGDFFCTSEAVDTPTKYGLNDFNKYFTNKFLPSVIGLERLVPVSRNSWANASLWFAYDTSAYHIIESNLRKPYTLKDSYSIAAAIKAILHKIDPSLRHEATPEYSKFLYDTTNPLTNTKFYVFIAPKSNILKGQYDQAAQKAETSLEYITKMLRDCFRCYWYIEYGKFKIEHIKYFVNGGSYSTSSNSQLDFTKLTDMFNKKRTSYFQSEIEFDKSELNGRYEFNWMDDVTEIFGSVAIDIDSKYVQRDKKEEVNVSQFSSDVDFMLFNPSNFSSDGFALLCATKSDGMYSIPIITSSLIDENGDEYSVTAQNWLASWAYLVDNFYALDMPAYKANVNVLKNFYVKGIKKCMSHTIEFPTAEDLVENEMIKTFFGDGSIDEISINLDTRVAKVKLLYEPQ